MEITQRLLEQYMLQQDFRLADEFRFDAPIPTLGEIELSVSLRAVQFEPIF
jgi:hypothetical protein